MGSIGSLILLALLDALINIELGFSIGSSCEMNGVRMNCSMHVAFFVDLLDSHDGIVKSSDP